MIVARGMGRSSGAAVLVSYGWGRSLIEAVAGLLRRRLNLITASQRVDLAATASRVDVRTS